MRIWRTCLAFALLFFIFVGAAQATMFGTVRGIVHDPDHRPVAGARVVLSAVGSDWSKQSESNVDGEFQFDAVALGSYVLRVSAQGFVTSELAITVESGSAPIFHLPLRVQGVSQQVRVTAESQTVDTGSSATRTLVERREIQQLPGADRSTSFAMITDTVPGAVLAHDQLHVRGGHQVSWLVDGVPVPNTNIASNVGPQFDPKDIASLEVDRGGLSADYGDRTYGVFNIVPRSGFERNRELELDTSLGSFWQTDDQLSVGSHTDRLAWYFSANGNRSDYGLAAPDPRPIHDLASGGGGFGSLFFNATPSDQLRLVASIRGDFFQIPNTPGEQAAGIRDTEEERDAFVNFSWVHTFNQGLLLDVSPFYHFNSAHLLGGPNDPIAVGDDRTSSYAGGQASLAFVRGRHNARVGVYTFSQRDAERFRLLANDGSGLSASGRVAPRGNLEAAFLDDQFRLTSWLTLNGGIRLTHFAGNVNENAADPRVGAAVRIPGLNWTLRGSYGRTYQAPPLSTVAGPIAAVALEQGFSFLPLHGERDEVWEVGWTIPAAGWTLDADYFHNRARNYFDHDAIGNSNLFFPLTIQSARLRGFESSLVSPLLARRLRLRIAYAHQFAEARGAVTGGLTSFSPPETAWFFLDHDQRNTLEAVTQLTLPWRAWVSSAVSFGSGFLNGNGPAHLPPHASLDVSMGKEFGERWSIRLTAVNVTNRRYLLDNSNTFGGTHWNDPRQIIGGVRFRFHY